MAHAISQQVEDMSLHDTSEKIVNQLKSRGIFDTFRKDCLADVDTRPAYQNLRQRVENTVTGFLSQQKWTPDLNRNQLRERLRKHLTESRFLEVGVDRIVDQVVDRNIFTTYMPQIRALVSETLDVPSEKPEQVDEELEMDDAADASTFGNWANQFHAPPPADRTHSSMSISSASSDSQPVNGGDDDNQEPAAVAITAAAGSEGSHSPDIRGQISPLSDHGEHNWGSFLGKADGVDLSGLVSGAGHMDPAIDEMIKSELCTDERPDRSPERPQQYSPPAPPPPPPDGESRHRHDSGGEQRHRHHHRSSRPSGQHDRRRRHSGRRREDDDHEQQRNRGRHHQRRDRDGDGGGGGGGYRWSSSSHGHGSRERQRTSSGQRQHGGGGGRGSPHGGRHDSESTANTCPSLPTKTTGKHTKEDVTAAEKERTPVSSSVYKSVSLEDAKPPLSSKGDVESKQKHTSSSSERRSSPSRRSSSKASSKSKVAKKSPALVDTGSSKEDTLPTATSASPVPSPETESATPTESVGSPPESFEPVAGTTEPSAGDSHGHQPVSPPAAPAAAVDRVSQLMEKYAPHLKHRWTSAHKPARHTYKGETAPPQSPWEGAALQRLRQVEADLDCLSVSSVDTADLSDFDDCLDLEVEVTEEEMVQLCRLGWRCADAGQSLVADSPTVSPPEADETCDVESVDSGFNRSDASTGSPRPADLGSAEKRRRRRVDYVALNSGLDGEGRRQAGDAEWRPLKKRARVELERVPSSGGEVSNCGDSRRVRPKLAI